MGSKYFWGDYSMNPLDVFHFDAYNIALCPNCERFDLCVKMATNKSVKIECGYCHKTWFYRRVENV